MDGQNQFAILSGLELFDFQNLRFSFFLSIFFLFFLKKYDFELFVFDFEKKKKHDFEMSSILKIKFNKIK